MKFFNKKRIERSDWIKVYPPFSFHRRKEMREWCRQHDSTGRFYTYYGSETWWFELQKDAEWFMLRWS